MQRNLYTHLHTSYGKIREWKLAGSEPKIGEPKE